MKIIQSSCPRLLIILCCISIITPAFSQKTINQPDDEDAAQVTAIRSTILSFVENKNWDGLRAFIKGPEYQRLFKRHILLSWDEKMMISLLCGDFDAVLKEQRSFSDIAYQVTVKNKLRYRPKIIPLRDNLYQKLFIAYAENVHAIKEKISADSSFDKQKKDHLLLKSDYYNLYTARDKRETIKQFDKQYKLFTHTYPNYQFREKIPFRAYSKWLKIGAFFGGGLSIGHMSGGNGKLFRNPVGYHMGFDVYTGKIDWYFQFNISDSKNKVDTMFKQVVWPAGTKNFVSDLQVGVGWVALRTDHLRWTIKAGVGSFSFQPVKSDANAALKPIKLKRLPYPSPGYSN